MIFLFYLNQQIFSQNFVTTLIVVTLICPFYVWKRNGKNIQILDVEIFLQKGKFVTTVYRKPTSSGVSTHFENFSTSIQKFGMIIP